jgi:23S rRNA (cytosine1962-C5)-methyltransferase
MSYRTIQLKADKQHSIKRFHPWIFSGAIQSKPDDLIEGEIVNITDLKNNFLAIAHYASGSIAARIISFTDQKIDQNFWNGKIKSAYQVRKNIFTDGFTDTNSYRLVHAEGDQLPGLIIDIYNDTAIVQCHSIGMFKNIENIKVALLQVYENNLKSIYDKSSETLHRDKTHESKNNFIYGETTTPSIILENKLKFYIDWVTGQKTGFFIDQRENRNLLAELCLNKKVLNTFCYSGGFTVYALAAGASKVVSVDSSQKALEMLEQNLLLNELDGSKHETVKADAVEYIKKIDSDFDIIILDPPAFAKNIHARHNAVQAYKRLNTEAIKRIKPGGILFTFSCSQVVDKLLFKNTIVSAAIEAGRNARILYHLQQPKDHPINIFHPEGEYLKGLVIEVD